MKSVWKLLVPAVILLASVAGWGQTATQTPTQTSPSAQTTAQAQDPAPGQAPVPAADPLIGDWKGNIADGVPIIVHIGLNGNAYVAAVDSPSQGTSGIPTTLTVDGNTITFRTLATTPSNFTGTIHGDTITGTFTEAGNSVPLALSRSGAATVPLAGDWQGTVAGSVPLTVHITNAIQGYRANTDSPSHGISGIRTAIAVNGAAVRLQIASSPPALFVGNQDGNTLTGVFTQGRNSTPMTFVRSNNAAISAVVGDWQGAVTDLVPIIFHIRSTGKGFVATTDSPSLSQNNLRTQIVVNGNQLRLRTIGTTVTTFVGAVNGNSMTGTLSSGRNSVQITLTRAVQ
jgi:hypothetical protein